MFTETIFELLSHQPYWEFEKDLLNLKVAEETIVSIRMKKRGRKAQFEFEDEPYEIEQKGYWNREISIKTEDQKVVLLRNGFWGADASIQFDKGNRYEMNVKNEPTVTLQFLDDSGHIIFKLMLTEDEKEPSLVLKILYHHIPKREMLFLMIMAAFSIKNIVAELSPNRKISIQ